MAKTKESDFISNREIKHMVESGKRYFSGTWDNYKESPYAEYERRVKRQKEENDTSD